MRKKAAKAAWRPQLTGHEKRMGWVFFALYLLVFPLMMAWLLRLLDNVWDLYFTEAVSSAAYYGVVLLILIAAFWEFLQNALRLFRQYLPENLFAVGTGLIGCLVLTTLVGFIPLPVRNPVLFDYKAQFQLAAGSTVAVVVFLRPMVEEILYRGLLFGSLRKLNRPLAYVVSTLLFAFGSVWQFAVPSGGPGYLLLALHYIPMGLAFCWSYDNGGSVLSPMILRVLVEGLGLAVLLHL